MITRNISALFVTGALLSAIGLSTTTLDAGDTVDVSLKPMILTDRNVVVRSGSPKTLEFNQPLVDRIALKPDDIKKLTVKFTCRQVQPQIAPLWTGRKDRTQINLAEEKALQQIQLVPGDRLATVGWKSSWHYSGYVKLEDIQLVGTFPGKTSKTIKLPKDFSKGHAVTELGEFSLVGISNRDKFPLTKEEKVMTSQDAGQFQVTGAYGTKIQITDKGIILKSQGKSSKKDRDYTWAPAVVFTPKVAGTYSLRGTLTVRSSEKGQDMAWLIGKLKPAGPSLKGHTLQLAAVSQDLKGNPEAMLSKKPLLKHRFSVDGIRKSATVSFDLTAVSRKWLEDGTKFCGLIASLTGNDGHTGAVTIDKTTTGTLTVESYPKHVLFDHKIKPTNGVYARNRNGQLYYGDQRLLLWSTVRSGSPERFRALGFNCIRVYNQGSFYTEESAKKGVAMSYTKGDGSKLDNFDRWMAGLREHDLFFMFGTMIGRGMPIKHLLDDDSWIAGGNDWEEWKQAVKKNDNLSFDYIDERLWKIRLKHADNVLNHVNQYTGKPYAREESIALIEINNERAMLKKWFEHGFEKWPSYFKAKLVKLWNQWLKEKYTDDNGLRKAWGSIKKGESLANHSIAPAPIVSQRKAYPVQRGNDFVRFLIELINKRNQEYVRFCRAQAPEGVGVNVFPFSFDSQYMPSIPWQYSNSLGDTSTISMYFWTHDSSLTKPPALYVLDSHRTADKLAVVYETGRSRPSPYRSEHPYMLAIMTAWQDFDLVSWHGHWMGKDSPEQLLAGKALPPTKHFWTGVHLEHDPTMTSSIALAGRIFLNRAVKASENPVVIEMGDDGANGYRYWNGIGGRAMSHLTFTRGTRVKFCPDRKGGILNTKNPLDGVKPKSEAVKTGDYVLWNWPEGKLIIDSPSAKVYVGPAIDSYRFSGGITLSGLNTEWIAFALVSADGKPLLGENATDRALISAVFDSANTGFKFDWSVGGSPVKQAKAVKKLGHAPVLVDEVHYSLSFPQELSGALNGYDFAMRQVSKVPIKGNTIRHRTATLWMEELVINSRGDSCTPDVDPSPGTKLKAKANLPMATESFNAKLASAPNPLPGLSWGDNFARAHRSIRDGAYLHGSVTPRDPADSKSMKISITNVERVFIKPADVEVQFNREGMSRILITYTENPTLAAVIKQIEEQHGKPAQANVQEDAFKESKVTWRVPLKQGSLTIDATEVQGIVRLSYSLSVK